MTLAQVSKVFPSAQAMQDYMMDQSYGGKAAPQLYAGIVFHSIPGDGGAGAAGDWDYSIRVNQTKLGQLNYARLDEGPLPFATAASRAVRILHMKENARGVMTERSSHRPPTSPWAGSRASAGGSTARRRATWTRASSRSRCVII